MTLPAGTVLEKRYRIDALLHQGGMGTVYRGYDLKLDIPLTLKEDFFQMNLTEHPADDQQLVWEP